MARLAWWVVGSQLITTTHTNVCSVATVRHANTTENKSRLDCSCGRALHAHVSALATYDCGRSGRDAAVSPSTAICSKCSAAESSAFSSLGQSDPESTANSLGQGDPERSANSLGQGDPERSASSSLGQGDPERSASSSLGQGDPERSASRSLD